MRETLQTVERMTGRTPPGLENPTEFPVELPGELFLQEFGLPNVYFHHAMAHVALKLASARLGKADYDGLHLYPDGFSFG